MGSVLNEVHVDASVCMCFSLVFLGIYNGGCAAIECSCGLQFESYLSMVKFWQIQYSGVHFHHCISSCFFHRLVEFLSR